MKLSQRFLPQKVKTKLLLALGSLIALMVLIPVFLVYRNTINRTVEEATIGLQQKIIQIQDKLVVDTTQKLSLLAKTVSDIPSVEKDMAERNREALQSVTEPMYKDLKQRLELNVFHFHLPPATSFLRLQKPEKFGDDLSGFRHTVVSVNATRKEASGIEVGKAGLSIRAVLPVNYHGQHVGSVEFGAPIDDKLVKSYKEIFHSEISVVVPDNGGFKYQAKTHSMTIPAKKFPFLKKMLQNEETKIERVTKNNRELLTAYMPLKDYSGKNVGILAVPFDMTDQLTAARKTAQTIALAGLVAILVIQGLVYLIFQLLINRPLKGSLNN